MASAKEIARIFACLSQDAEGKSIENTRLNKLVYFAQGHALGETGRALFDNQIDAWEHGPVVAVVYTGFQKIIEAAEERGMEGIQIDPTDMEIILDVWNQYGKYRAGKLVELTHREGTPWAESYIPQAKNVHIPLQTIKAYFSRPENRLHRITDRIGSMPTVSALPADEYNPEEDSIWEALLHDTP